MLGTFHAYLEDDMRKILSILTAALSLLCIATGSPAAQYFAPDVGKGPAVLLLSGASGPTPYKWYAMDIAKLGYTAVVVAGKDVSAIEAAAAENLQKEIAELQRDRRVAPGKVAVIGFSQGGGGAVVHATVLQDRVSAVVAYYPAITKVADLQDVGKRIKVPTLVFAGERDRYFNCCLVESMRTLAAGATGSEAPFELVVYPSADHGFNLDGPQYSPSDSADAWERTKAFLAKLHPAK